MQPSESESFDAREPRMSCKEKGKRRWLQRATPFVVISARHALKAFHLRYVAHRVRLRGRVVRQFLGRNRMERTVRSHCKKQSHTKKKQRVSPVRASTH